MADDWFEIWKSLMPHSVTVPRLGDDLAMEQWLSAEVGFYTRDWYYEHVLHDFLRVNFRREADAVKFKLRFG